MDSPIIRTLLDSDYYKWTMSRFIWQYYPGAIAEFSLINRTPDYNLLHISKEELEEQLRYVMKLHMPELRQLPELGSGYNLALRQSYLPPFRLKKTTDVFELTFKGPWWITTLWETLAMSIVSELYNKRATPTPYGAKKHLDTIAVLKCMPELKITDFGTRRRYSRAWHYEVVQSLKENTKVLVGTSNVAMAAAFDLPRIGTMAHELFMGVAALYSHSLNSLRGSQQIVLRQWEELYGPDFLIALSDTWGTKFFWNDWTKEQATKWDGVRQDSGDPVMFGREFHEWYRSNFIPMKEKKVVFSDNLSLAKILILQDEFGRLFKPSFGWGTNLTNDMGLPRPSIVVKLTSINGIPTVKLSDDPGKTQGPHKEQNWYRRAFDGQGIFGESAYTTMAAAAARSGYRQ